MFVDLVAPGMKGKVWGPWGSSGMHFTPTRFGSCIQQLVTASNPHTRPRFLPHLPSASSLQEYSGIRSGKGSTFDDLLVDYTHELAELLEAQGVTRGSRLQVGGEGPGVRDMGAWRMGTAQGVPADRACRWAWAGLCGGYRLGEQGSRKRLKNRLNTQGWWTPGCILVRRVGKWAEMHCPRARAIVQNVGPLTYCCLQGSGSFRKLFTVATPGEGGPRRQLYAHIRERITPLRP